MHRRLYKQMVVDAWAGGTRELTDRYGNVRPIPLMTLRDSQLWRLAELDAREIAEQGTNIHHLTNADLEKASKAQRKGYRAWPLSALRN